MIHCRNVISSNLNYCCDHTSNCCDTAVGKSWVTLPRKPITRIDSAYSTATLHLSISTTRSIPSMTSVNSSSAASATSYESTASSPFALHFPPSPLNVGANAGMGVWVLVSPIAITILLLLPQ
ncbi:hypothetical protein N7G274_006067 [Stereocaulon virgatum]|uniref:Uncharacterized protein n=1 Tax=Stereocaulon virgatum TaxID=373712 RepID=A0ABR4ACL1_9LECA